MNNLDLKNMDFFAEDLGRVAKLRVDAKNIEFKGIEPKKMGSIEVAQVGKARVVVCRNSTKEELKALLHDFTLSEAIKDAWVLALHDSEYDEEFMNWVHPYVTVVKASQILDFKLNILDLEEHSRGWNVEDEAGEHAQRKCIVVGKDANAVEVLFGESRENPIGLLSIRCLGF